MHSQSVNQKPPASEKLRRKLRYKHYPICIERSEISPTSQMLLTNVTAPIKWELLEQRVRFPSRYCFSLLFAVRGRFHRKFSRTVQTSLFWSIHLLNNCVKMTNRIIRREVFMTHFHFLSFILPIIRPTSMQSCSVDTLDWTTYIV